MSGGKGEGRASRFSGRLAQVSGELEKVEEKKKREGEEERGASSEEGASVVVTKILCRDDESLCFFFFKEKLTARGPSTLLSEVK